jgi:TP901 family phage tail tape measure protein
MASAAELVVLLTAKDMASKTLAGFGQQLGGMGGLAKVATAGLATVAAAGVGLATGLVQSVGAAMDFEAAMSAVQAVAGGTDADLKALSDTAIQLGQDTTLSGIGATEAAQAMRELAAAGLSVDDIVGGAALGALRLASAGGIDVARAAEIAAMALANFGLAGSDAAMVADLFASAANSSAISVDDIAEAMKYVGPIASSMGLSIKEVTATIAALGNQGIKGSAAGTALRSMLVNLASPSKQAAKLIKELGLEFFDANGQMKNLAGISEELKAGMAGLTDQQRAHALSTIFGNEAMTAATVLYGEGAAGINKWLSEIQNGATAAQVGAMRNDNLKGSIEALKSSFETAQIVLGTAFLPALKQLADLATGAVNASIPLIKAWGPQLAAALSAGLGALPGLVERAATAVGSLVTAFRALASGDINGMFGPILAAIEAAFGPAAMARAAGGVSLFLTALEQLRGVVNLAREAFAQLPTPVQQLIAGFLALGPAVRVAAVVVPLLLGALTGLGPIVGFLTSTIPVLGAVIAALGAPLTLTIAAVAALALAWTQNWFGIRDATMPIVTQLVGFVTGTLIPGLQQLGAFVTGTLVPQFMAGWAQIQAAVQAALAVIVPAMVQIGDATIAAFNAALPGIMAFIAGVQQLGAAVLPVLSSVASAVMSSLGPAMAALEAWAREVIPQFAAAWSNVASIVGPLIGALASQIGAALSAIAGFITAHSAQIQVILGGAWQAMSSMIGAVLTVITGLISSALLAISGDWRGAWDRLVQTVTTARGQVEAAIAGMTQAIIGMLVLGLQTMVSAAQSAWTALVAATQSAMAQMAAAVQNGVGQIPGILYGIMGAAAAAAAAIGAAIIDGIAGALSAGAGRLASIAASVVNSALDAAKGALGIKSPSKEFAEVGRDIVAGLVKGMDEKQQDAAKKAADVVSAVMKAVADTLGAMKALANFDFAVDSPTGEAMGWFRLMLEALVATMAEAARWFDTAALEQVNTLSETMGKVGGGVKGILDGLAALAAHDFATQSASGETLGWFAHMMTSLVQTLAEVARQVGGEGLAAAKQVGESAGQIGGAVKSTLEGFKALAEYDFTKGSPTGEAMGWFRHLMESIVLNFAQAATLVGGEGMTKAREFAQAVSDVVTAAKNALELFAKLKEFEGIPAKALEDMHTALEGALDFATKLFQRAEAIKAEAAAFANSMKEAARLFTEGMSLGNGMGGMTVPSAPLGVGGGNGGGGGTPGGLGGAPVYTMNFNGDIYDGARFEDRVVDAIQVADRRGR